MIDEKNINKMYDELIGNNELTTRKLNECGFNSKDLTVLLENKTLERIKRGHYVFLKTNSLYSYGKRLISLKQYDKAMSCFEKCHELNPNHAGSSFQLFLNSIYNRDYEKCFYYFEYFCGVDNRYYDADNNFYLYLLSMITEIPEKYREYIKSLEFIDVRVDYSDKRYEDIPTQNTIRSLAFNHKFISAFTKLKDLIRKHNNTTVQDMVTRSLLEQAIKAQSNIKNEILGMVTLENYDGLIVYLEKQEKLHNLSLTDSYILLLTKKLLNIIETYVIPKASVFKSDSLFEAIDGDNYELALTLCQKYIGENNVKPNEKIIYLLLERINVEVKKILKNEFNGEKETNNSNIFDVILERLKKQDLDNAFIILRTYLDKIGKRKYESLIIDLIKLSILDKDMSFIKPMDIITNINKDDFEFNISYYIQNFYIALSQNKFDEARIYLHIISASDRALSNNLRQTLNVTYEFNKSVGIVVENHQTEEKAFDDDDEDVQLINQELENLYKNGVVLLEPMNRKKRLKIHEIVNRFLNVDSYNINVENSEERRIFLKHITNFKDKETVNEILKLGNEAYINGDHDSCINAYRSALKFGKNDSYIYAKIGLCYKKKNDFDMADAYLTIAVGLLKEEYNIINHCGIYNIREISNLVSSGVPFDEVCRNMELDSEQQSIVLSLFAKDCYVQENYEMGDQFLKRAEGVKEKTKYVNALIEKIRKNKFFYKGIENEKKHKLLVLTSNSIN